MLLTNAKVRQLIAALLASLLCLALAEGYTATACLKSPDEVDVSACEQELLDNPGNARVRKILSEALIKLGRRQEAIRLLANGVELSPDDGQMRDMLKLQQSFLEEQEWAAKQSDRRAANASGRVDPKAKLNMIRCTKLQGKDALDACDSGLELLPDNLELLLGKSDALLDMNRVVEAIQVLSKADAAHPGNAAVAEKQRTAASKRNLLTRQCLTLTGNEALRACDGALLKGASDELRIKQRRSALMATAEGTDAKRQSSTIAQADVSRTAAADSRKTGTSPQSSAQSARTAVSVAAAGARYSNAPIAPGVSY